MPNRPAEDITIYTAPDCAACTLTKDRFTAKGVQFTEKDFLSESPEKQAELKRTVGQQAPLVVTENHGSWAGMNPGKVREVVKAHAASGNQSAATAQNSPPAVAAGPRVPGM